MPSPPDEAIAQNLFVQNLIQAQSDAVEAQEKALQALSALTKVSIQNRNLLAQTDDAISTIFTLSESSANHIQILSLSLLLSLSLNANLKRSLATLDNIYHLNSIILSPATPHAGKLAASLVCSLAVLDKNKAVFGVAGTIQVVVKALHNAAHSAARHLLSSLAELMQFHGNCTLALRAGAVPVLLRILQGPADDLAGSCLSVLVLLSRYEEGIGEILAVDGVAGILVDALERGCTLSGESTVELLVKLFDHCEECKREAVGMPEFASLIADLMIRGSTKAREKAGLLMKMMMEVNS